MRRAKRPAATIGKNNTSIANQRAQGGEDDHPDLDENDVPEQNDQQPQAPLGPRRLSNLKLGAANASSTCGVKRPGSCLGLGRRTATAPTASGGEGPGASKAYKCPVPNYRGPLGQRGTLGMRRVPLAPLQQLMRQLRTVISPEAASGDSDPSAACEPLCIFDPSAEPPDSPRAALSPLVVEPFLARQLRSHQREGVRFMVACISGLRQEGMTGCILCDGMGLGKTFQSIATLWTLLTSGVHGGRPTASKPLILCPASLVANWGAELTRWLEGRVAPVVVDDTRGEKVKEALAGFGGHAAVRAGKPQVLVMGYTTFRIHREAVVRKGVDILVCDEAHTLKNGESQLTQAVASLPARMRLLLSGTPIQNDLTEFFTLFNVAVPGLLGEPAAFRRTFENPILRGQDADASDPEVAVGAERCGQLLELCGRFMLRRTCGLMKQYLPPKVEQVVFCRMSPLQARLYHFFLASPPVQRALMGRAAARDKAHTAAARRAGLSEGHGGGGGSTRGGGPGEEAGAAGGNGSGSGGGRAPGQADLSVLAAITTVKKMCCHPDLIYSMFGAANGHHPMGLSAAMATSARQPKRAAAAAGCIGGGGGGGASFKEGADGRPVVTGFEGCQPLFSDSAVSPAYKPGACQAYHCGKVAVLEMMLKAVRESGSGDKVVLVSNYTEALDVLEVMCRTHGWGSLRLDGSCAVKARQPIVDTFNDPAHPSFVLLLSSKAGGVGLNIIGANRLVLFDPDWNPANDLQAMARVWRQGQKKRVWIYRLLTTGTIEEKVYQRQIAKQGLSAAIVDDTAAQSRTFSQEELRALFEVNTTTMCDTHSAIKCACDGSASTAHAKQQQQKAAAAAAAAAEAAEDASGEGGNVSHGQAAGKSKGAKEDYEGGAVDDGIMQWAHLASVADSVDPIWRSVSSWLRDKFTTYLFSDHIINESPQQVQVVEDEEEGEASEEEQGKAGCDDVHYGDYEE